MDRKTAVVFGFGPFDIYKENPSQSIAMKLDGLTIGGAEVSGHVLTVDHARVEKEIIAELDRHKPSVALGLGLAAGRTKLSVEKVAINYMPVRTRGGNKKLGGAARIDACAPDGIFANINPEKIVEVLNRKGIPASLSLSAGSFLCNHAMFIIVREAVKRGMAGGFIHLPCDESLATALKTDNCPSMSISTMERGIRISVECVLKDWHKAESEAFAQ